MKILYVSPYCPHCRRARPLPVADSTATTWARLDPEEVMATLQCQCGGTYMVCARDLQNAKEEAAAA